DLRRRVRNRRGGAHGLADKNSWNRIKVVIKRAGPGRLGLRKQAQTGMDGKGTRACPRSDGAPDRAVDQPSRGVIGFRKSAQAAWAPRRADPSLSARLPVLLEPRSRSMREGTNSTPRHGRGCSAKR